MHKLPTWAVWSIIPATVVLVPVVAFLTAIAIAMLLGALKEAGVPTLVALAEAGVIGCLLVHNGGYSRLAASERKRAPV